eukprot:13667389-Alexandrium_andersonii.AAC.1
MSASLVGSEMCIRDRNKTKQTHNLEVGPLTPGRVCSAWMLDSEPGDGRVPVSYTHLTLPTICSV